jgi:hypothetical protein
MSRVVELFGHSATDKGKDWTTIVIDQQCVFTGRKCYKVRKSGPQTSIGSCTVLYGKPAQPVIICPIRLIERRQVFVDCLHLLNFTRAWQ